MRVVDSRPIFFVLSVLSFYLSSFSIAFMPLASFDDDSKRSLSAALAVIFWIFLMTGVVLTFRVRKQRIWDNKYKPKRGSLPHALRFFSNKPAIFFDLLLIFGIIMIIVSLVTFLLPEWFTWEIMFITVFSLEMHLVFNGKNYDWLSTLPKRLKEPRR